MLVNSTASSVTGSIIATYGQSILVRHGALLVPFIVALVSESRCALIPTCDETLSKELPSV